MKKRFSYEQTLNPAYLRKVVLVASAISRLLSFYTEKMTT